MELENAKGSEHESIFTIKMAFLECFQTVFFLTTSRAECSSAYKISTVNIREVRISQLGSTD